MWLEKIMAVTTPSFWAAKRVCKMAPFSWLNTPLCPMEMLGLGSAVGWNKKQPKRHVAAMPFPLFSFKKTLQLFSTHSIIVEWENVCCPPLLNNLDTVFTFAMNFLGQNFRKEILRQKHSEKEICEEKKWTVDYVINSLYKILCRNACTIYYTFKLLNFFSFFVDQIS